MAFLEVFHLRPWEVERLTADQVRSLAGRVDDMNREAEKQEAEARRNG